MDPPCSLCNRDGFYGIPHVPLQLVYSGQLPAFDVAETYECFGRSVLRPDFTKSGFARPKLVVSEVIKNILEGERGVDFERVTYYP